ncbi:MAG: chemotaxis protein CheR [Desulfovibrio sp.]|nr:chemotaxis protein CheR [Desulfovibrio sp.]
MSTQTPFQQKPFAFGQRDKDASKENKPLSSQFSKPQTFTAGSFTHHDDRTQPFGSRSQEQAKPFSAFRQTQTQTQTSTQTRPFSTQSAKPASSFGARQSSPFAAQTSQTTTPTFGSQRPASPSFGSQASSRPAAQSSTRPFFRAGTSTSQDHSTSSFHSTRPLHLQTPSFHKDMSISDEEFVLLRDFIYKKCGIFIAENRKYLIENRLSNRIKHLNLKSYSEYYKYLKFDDNKDAELNELYVLMTTNETSFFRNPPQLKVFQEIVLTNMINEIRKTGQKRLRIWSAGCSTGEEPYTLAIIISEVLKGELLTWDVKITANDLSTQVLAAARNGIYSEYSLRTTPKELVSRYFTKDGQVYKINPEMKRLVNFGQINLNEREQLKRVESSHIVFCRNVIIYFDDDMKRRVINSFYDNLLPGGALLIGHSETLHNICRSFELEHYSGTIVYRKQK